MSSMKCTIPGVNLKVFGRAVQSLSKLGDELYWEPREDGLFLRSVNSSRSAYGCFQFCPSFFSHYIDGVTESGNKSHDNEDDVVRCKLGMKSVMAVFKSLSTIDKTVEKCRISLDTAESRLVFQMYCRHGIIKTHKLAFIECETLQAVYSKDMCPNKLTAVPKLLCDAVLNFQNNQEEITLIIRPQFMALKNYVDEPDSNKVVHTELTLSPEEFDQYQAGVDADVTFCLKELRAVLAFADITSLPITLQFETAGRPITFSIASDLSFEANFVLATLAEVELSDGARAREPMSNSSGYHNRKGTAGKQNSVHNGRDSLNRNSSNSNNRHTERSKNSTNTSSQSLNPPVHSNSLKDKAGPSSAVDEMMDDDDDDELSMLIDVTVPEESYTFQPPTTTTDKNISEAIQPAKRKVTLQNETGNDEDYSDWDTEVSNSRHFFSTKPSLNTRDKPAEFQKSNEKESSSGETTQNSQSKQNHLARSETLQKSSGSNRSCDLQVTKQKYLSLKCTKSSGEEVSPVVPMQDTNMSPEEESEEEEIPVTPPSKKFRSVFFGTQSSTQSTQSQQKVILAPDSEEDD